MQVLKKDLRSGIVNVKIHTLDDLWHLQKILDVGDLVTTKTRRKVVFKRGQEIEEGERKPMVLTLKVEDMEFKKDNSSLRVKGPIEAGPEDIQLNSYHTVSIRPGSEVKIKKQQWKSYHLDALEQAKSQKSIIFICMIDRDNANFAELRESGLEMLGSIKAKKFEENEKRDEYYDEIMKFLEKKKDFKNIIVAGPGFERENLFDYIKNKNSELAEKIVLHHASSIVKSGINEVLKTSADQILTKSRVTRETQYVEEVFKRIKTDGLVTYGPDDTTRAIEMGAAETLLVSDEKVNEFEEMMNKTEKTGGKVIIISSDHEVGEGFLHLGGIAALLRFRFS